MSLAELVDALTLPASCRVDQRVPKKMLVDNGAPTAADKRLLADAIEAMQWVAALKPDTVAVPEYRDTTREYLEIAVLAVEVRETHCKPTQLRRLAELVHRAVPYPVLLLLALPGQVLLSAGHKRAAQNESGKVVLDGEMVLAEVAPDSGMVQPFLQALALSRQPALNLYTLYQGWMDTVISLQVALVTGVFAASASTEQAAARHQALLHVKKLQAEIARLKALAVKEKQMSRQVELNLTIKRLEQEKIEHLALLGREKA